LKTKRKHFAETEHPLLTEKPSDETPLEDWLDNQDVMQTLHISPRTLQTLRSNGILPFSRIGNKTYYRRQDIIKILSDNYTLNKIRNILRLYYSDEIVLRLIGRDCGLYRNPFNFNKETLHVFIEKSDLTNAMSAEFARHSDIENAIPAGDAFSFAELHYKQSSEEFLQPLNKELYLRISEERRFHANIGKPSVCLQIPKSPCSPFNPLFSFFKAPISNTQPHKAVVCYRFTTLSKAITAKTAHRNCGQFWQPPSEE
jgi:DNA-binding transcriptional MerR regulator